MRPDDCMAGLDSQVFIGSCALARHSDHSDNKSQLNMTDIVRDFHHYLRIFFLLPSVVAHVIPS